MFEVPGVYKGFTSQFGEESKYSELGDTPARFLCETRLALAHPPPLFTGWILYANSPSSLMFIYFTLTLWLNSHLRFKKPTHDWGVHTITAPFPQHSSINLSTVASRMLPSGCFVLGHNWLFIMCRRAGTQCIRSVSFEEPEPTVYFTQQLSFTYL